jgi:WD40 repeat protein
MRGPALRLLNRPRSELSGPLLQTVQFDPPATVTACAFSHDGSLIVAGSYDGRICVWESETGQICFQGEKLHPEPVLSCAFWPNDADAASPGRKPRWIASASARLIMLWDAITGKFLGFAHPPEPIDVCAFGDDGEMIITLSRSKSIRRWKRDSETNMLIEAASARQHDFIGRGKAWFDSKILDRPSSACALSDGGRLALHAFSDGSVEVYDADKSYIIESMKEKVSRMLAKAGIIRGTEVHACAIAADGSLAVSGYADGFVCIWDLRTRKLQGRFEAHTNKMITACAVERNGRRFASGCESNDIKIWNRSRESPEATLTEHGDRVICCSFSHDGERVISGSKDKTLRLWKVTEAIPKGHNGAILACQFSPGRREEGGRASGPGSSKPKGFLVTGGKDGTLRFWDGRSGEEIHPAETPVKKGASITALAFSPNGQTLVVCATDGWVQFLKTDGFDQLSALMPSGSSPILSCSIAANAKRMLTNSKDGVLTLWDFSTRQPIGPHLTHSNTGWAPSFSPDGRFFLSASKDGSLSLRHAADGAEAALLSGQIRGAFAPDSRSMATADRDGSVAAWQLGRAIERSGNLPESHGGAAVFDFSPDGRFLASASAGEVRLWAFATPCDLATASKQAPLRGFAEGRITGLSFSPNGVWLATAAENNSPLILWDLRDTEPAFMFDPTATILSCKWRADGRVLAACDAGGRIYLLEPYWLKGEKVPDFPLLATPWRNPEAM